MKTKVITGATIKCISYDLINGITTLMVGSRLVEVNLDEYRTLKRYLNSWTSGLKRISETVWYYSRKNVVSHIAYNGLAESAHIERMLGIKCNY